MYVGSRVPAEAVMTTFCNVISKKQHQQSFRWSHVDLQCIFSRSGGRKNIQQRELLQTFRALCGMLLLGLYALKNGLARCATTAVVQQTAKMQCLKHGMDDERSCFSP